MLRTLVVPLDGSVLAERALPYAIRLARTSRGRLVLVRVALAAVLDQERHQRAETETVAETYLSDLANKLSSVGVQIDSMALYGQAVSQILEAVKQADADGVVMATHGRTGLAHLTHGSVAEAVLARSSVPVFLVQARPGQKAARTFDPATARLLVPLDGSPFAEAALQPAVEVLGASGELTLTYVVAPAEQVERDEYGRVLAYLDQLEQSASRDARDYLSGVSSRITQEHPSVGVSIDVRIGEAAPGIVAAAVDRGAHLVVMATHGRTGLGRAVLGSVAGAVLRTGSTPVLLVRPSATAEAPAEATEASAPGMTVFC